MSNSRCYVNVQLIPAEQTNFNVHRLLFLEENRKGHYTKRQKVHAINTSIHLPSNAGALPSLLINFTVAH